MIIFDNIPGKLMRFKQQYFRLYKMPINNKVFIERIANKVKKIEITDITSSNRAHYQLGNLHKYPDLTEFIINIEPNNGKYLTLDKPE